jgi:hypothetical protein
MAEETTEEGTVKEKRRNDENYICRKQTSDELRACSSNTVQY